MPRTSILLVERDPQVGGLLDLFLHGRGFDVRVAASVAEARRLAAERAPDIVVIAERSDEIIAANAARELRALLGERPRMVALTEHPHVEGVDAILPLYCHPRDLVLALHDVGHRPTVAA